MPTCAQSASQASTPTTNGLFSSLWSKMTHGASAAATTPPTQNASQYKQATPTQQPPQQPPPQQLASPTRAAAAPAPAPQPAVTRLGKYEISDRVLGEGGYAKVVLGRSVETDERVAVKLLSSVASGRRNATSEASVVREVAAMRRACTQRHENVSHFFDYYRLGANDGSTTHAVVLELCKNGELYKVVERYGALAEDAIRPLFAGIVSGLHHLHSNGVAHRDLKLENILLGGAQGRTPKIGDLGLSHSYAHDGHGGWDDARLLTSFCGSRSYCAPEVMQSLGYNGFTADIWSLGVCLFGLASGFFPVEEASPRDWRYEKLARLQHLEPHKSPCHEIYGFYGRSCPLSPELVTLLNGMLQVQPSCRSRLSEVAASAWLQGRALPPPAAAVAPVAPAVVPPHEQLSAPVEVVIDRGDPHGAAEEAEVEMEDTDDVQARYRGGLGGALMMGEMEEVDVSDAVCRAAPISMDSPADGASAALGGGASSKAGGAAGASSTTAASSMAPPMLSRQRAHSRIDKMWNGSSPW